MLPADDAFHEALAALVRWALDGHEPDGFGSITSSVVATGGSFPLVHAHSWVHGDGEVVTRSEFFTIDSHLKGPTWTTPSP